MRIDLFSLSAPVAISAVDTATVVLLLLPAKRPFSALHRPSGRLEKELGRDFLSSLKLSKFFVGDNPSVL
jgi:hypothetical protein